MFINYSVGNIFSHTHIDTQDNIYKHMYRITGITTHIYVDTDTYSYIQVYVHSYVHI